MQHLAKQMIRLWPAVAALLPHRAEGRRHSVDDALPRRSDGASDSAGTDAAVPALPHRRRGFSVDLMSPLPRLLGRAAALRPQGPTRRVEGDPDIHLNEKSRFAPPPGMPAGPLVVCRHLSLHHLDLRTGPQPDSKAARSFRDFSSLEAISRSHPPELEAAYKAMCSNGADGVFDHAGLCAHLADTLSQMTLSGETRRSFVVALEQARHMTALYLEVAPAAPGGARSFLVTLYDPNATACETVIELQHPDQLRGMDLFHLPDGPYRSTYALYDRPRAPHPPQPVSRFLEDTPGLKGLTAKLAVGWMAHDRAFAAQVEQAVRSGDRDRHTALAKGFTTGMLEGAPGMRDYMKCVIGQPGLSEDERNRLLGCDALLVSSRDMSSIRRATQHGTSGSIRAWGDIVSGAPAHVFTPQVRVKLLLGCTPDPDRFPPVLHELCNPTDAHQHYPAARAAAEHLLFDYLSAALSSPHLDTRQKAAVCCSLSGGLSAAQAALLRGQPRKAAALLTAVLQLGGEARRELLAATCFGKTGRVVTVEGVLRDLRASPDDDSRRWAQRLEEAAVDAGLLPLPSAPGSDREAGGSGKALS